MNIQQFCNKNATLITTKKYKILYSYSTPVAILIDNIWKATDYRDSITTTTARHISQITGFKYNELDKIDINKLIGKI